MGMLGVLSTKNAVGAAFAPSTPAAMLPVGGAPAVDHAIDAMLAAGVDELCVDSDDHDTVARLHDRYPSLTIVDDESPALDAHDTVLWVPATAVVDPGALSVLAQSGGGVLRRPSEPFSPIVGPEPRPVAVPADAFAGRPPSAALAVARELDVDEALERFERTLVADVRRPWELLDANEWLIAGADSPDPEGGFDGLSRQITGDVHPDAELIGAVVVREGAEIGPGVVIEGPALVMPGATVGPNCYVRSVTLIAEDVHLGASVEVKNSVLLDGAKVPHLSYVGDSVVGPDANVGAGSLVANLRHDGQAVRLTHNDCRVSTGRRKFGVVIGEGSKLAIGTRLNVGTVLSPESTTLPGEVVLRDKEPTGSEQG